MKKAKKYFISYLHKKDGSYGVGFCQIEINGKIKDIEQLDCIRDRIKEKENNDEVVIINWKPFEC